MSEKLTIGSLFSGIGGFEYVAQLYGIEPVWASEIEEPCIRITKRHFPNMKHYGDITKMKGDEIEPVDIISGGSPCQSLSHAGNQDGIKHKCSVCGELFPIDYKEQTCPKCGAEIEFTRSGLFMEQIRIIKEMRKKTNECYPKIIIWENVTGALNSNNGDDFYCVLNEFAGLFGEKLPTLRPQKWCKAGEIVGDNGSLAWRTLDAQYWGVAQRRRRIYLIVDLTGQRAGEILFKSESLRRHTPQSQVPWERASGKTENSIRATIRKTEESLILNDQGGSVMDISTNVTGTLRAETHGHAPVVVSDKEVYGLCSLASNCMKSDNPDSGCYKADVSKTLDTSGTNPSCNQGGNVVVENSVYCIQGNCIDRADTAGCNGKGWTEDVCYTLTTIDRPAVVYETAENKSSAGFAYQIGGGCPYLPYNEEKSPTLVSNQQMAVMIENHPADSRVTISEDICQTLTSRMGTGGGNVPLVMEYSEDDIVMRPGTHVECGIGVTPPLAARDYKDPQILLRAEKEQESDNKTLVSTTGCFMHSDVEVANTLMSRDYKDPQIVLKPNSVVRRLTPLECTRLQGFPDGWVDGESDAAQYKALGNSVALPCVNYVMSGVVDVLDSE